MLHGGGRRRENMLVSPTQLSVLRMIPIAERIARVGRDELAVYRLLNSERGWDAKHTPVHDVEWALREVHARLGHSLPTCLVGHSLGGRAAILAAGAPEVRSAVALAPWVYPQDGDIPLVGRQVLVVHGSRDRIAKEQYAAAMAERLRRGGAQVTFVRVDGGKHAMLAHHRIFDGLAADFAAATLLGTSNNLIVERALRGEELIKV